MSTINLVPPDHTLPHLEHRAELSAPEPAVAWRRILVAVDGSPATDVALRAVQALTRETPSVVEIAVIYAPRIPLPAVPERRGLDVCERCDRVEVAQLVKAVRRRCRAMIPHRAERAAWRFHLEVGDPGNTLVRLSTELHADLVIVGLTQRDRFDIVSGERTSVCASRYLRAPLLAAASHEEPITRAIVVLPDGRPHPATVRSVLATVSRSAKLWVVRPGNEWSITALDEDRVRDELRVSCGPAVAPALDNVRLEQVLMSNDMLAGVLQLAQNLDAQLIAIPNYGDPGPVRRFLPNLAEPLLRSAQCSVLVVPDDSARTV